jgi:hypothetical protein
MSGNDDDFKVYFHEKQRFRQWWVWLLLIVLNGLLAVTLYHSFTDDQASVFNVEGYALLFSGVVTSAVTLFMLIAFLETEFSASGISVRLYPFHTKFKHFDWKSIEGIEVRTYHPIREYGGWGLRGKRNDAAWNISGNQGLQLHFKNGTRLLIGTNQAQQMNEALSELQPFRNAT